MKLIYLLLSISQSQKIIKNINIPSCRNCLYYKVNNLDSDFTSGLNRCEKFGAKDIVTDKISYDFAVSCRSDESKCGEVGKYFEEEPNIDMKIFQHKLISIFPFSLPITILIVNIFLKILLKK